MACPRNGTAVQRGWLFTWDTEIASWISCVISLSKKRWKILGTIQLLMIFNLMWYCVCVLDTHDVCVVVWYIWNNSLQWQFAKTYHAVYSSQYTNIRFITSFYDSIAMAQVWSDIFSLLELICIYMCDKIGKTSIYAHP